MADKKDYHVEVAEQLIKEIEAGTAPWQKPWEPGIDMLPHNPTTDRSYNGFNAILLMCRNPDEPRWMTYKQAQAKGWQVRQGERETIIRYYIKPMNKKLN
jgi:antirestriction protein ArdC